MNKILLAFFLSSVVALPSYAGNAHTAPARGATDRSVPQPYRVATKATWSPTNAYSASVAHRKKLADSVVEMDDE